MNTTQSADTFRRGMAHKFTAMILSSLKGIPKSCRVDQVKPEKHLSGDCHRDIPHIRIISQCCKVSNYFSFIPKQKKRASRSGRPLFAYRDYFLFGSFGAEENEAAVVLRENFTPHRGKVVNGDRVDDIFAAVECVDTVECGSRDSARPVFVLFE